MQSRKSSNLVLFNFLLFVLPLLLLYSCSPVRRLGVISYKPKEPEVFTKQSLVRLMKSNPEPKIVLRVPGKQDAVTDENPIALNPIYNTIEKSLLKSGFKVRDRGLFNELLEKHQSNDYSTLKNIIDTDLILELVGIDDDVEYHTNMYKDTKGKERVVGGDILRIGASIEFKVIMVENNELVGTYKFHYAPCENGCKYYIDRFGRTYKSSHGSKPIKGYEVVVESNQLEKFIERCMSDLVLELRGEY